MRRSGGLWTLTNHPFLIGRPGRLLALEGLMDEVLAMSDVWTAPLREIADHVRGLELTPRVIAPYRSEPPHR